MPTVYDIYRIDGPEGPAVFWADDDRRLDYVAGRAEKAMRGGGWYAVGVRPNDPRYLRWSYVNTRDPDPEIPELPPPATLIPLPMRDNPVARQAARRTA